MSAVAFALWPFQHVSICQIFGQHLSFSGVLSHVILPTESHFIAHTKRQTSLVLTGFLRYGDIMCIDDTEYAQEHSERQSRGGNSRGGIGNRTLQG